MSKEPSPHERWTTGILGAPPVSEPLATCDACVMLPEGNERHEPGTFNPTTKCCTYTPRLASFLVGAVLADDAPAMAEGRARLLARIASRAGVSPLGIGPRAYEAALYGTERFGTSEILRCPYYVLDGGGCSIWLHRNSTCRTWFCKHGRGGVGKRFWRALERLLTAAEMAVARHCVLELEVGASAHATLFVPPTNTSAADAARPALEDRVDDATYAARWGSWLGREAEFFERAHRIAASLTWAEVSALGGVELRALERVVREAADEQRREALPARVRARVDVLRTSDGLVRLATYSPYDPIDLPAEAVPLLLAFQGGSLEDARRRVREAHGVSLDDALVRKLIDFDVLVEE
jgi:hypothetical protein